MCGIVAYRGKNKCLPFLLEGLKLLEYRGYDSAGICVSCGKSLLLYKNVGSVDDLKNLVRNPDLEAYSGIGHTRWATHGRPCKRNSHPHMTHDCRLSIVHNGIIENYAELKKSLEPRYKFLSDTDSEVLLYLIYDFMVGGLSLFDATNKALEKVVGAYAIALIDREDPDNLVVARKGSPVVVGLGDNETFVASDRVALMGCCSNIIYLKDNTICKIGNNVMVYDMTHGCQIDYEIEKVYDNIVAISKENYDSYMLKEIYEQSKAIDDALAGRLDGYRIKLGGLIGHEEIFKKAKHITIVACGSSWHSGLIAKYYLEEFCKIKVSVEYASEFRYRKPFLQKEDVVIGISQSGETADTLAALELAKNKGCFVVGLCNIPNSSMSRLTDCGIYLRAGIEVGVASTKTFSNQVICLLMLALWIDQQKKLMEYNQRKYILDGIRDLVDTIDDAFSCNENVEYIAETFKNMNNCLFLGRGYGFPVALEGALKLKEISYVHAEGYPAAEMKHGPIALVDKNMPVLVIANNEQNSKIQSNIEEIRARDGKVITISSQNNIVGDFKIRVPLSIDVLSPIICNIPLQLFAYYGAKLRGFNVDKPRNLAKSVTVE